MADDNEHQDIHDALGIMPTDEIAAAGPVPAAKLFARSAGELSGVSDLIRAIASGKPENMLYAGGMLGIGAVMPAARAEKAAMTMGKLFPEATWLGPSAAMHPQDYVDKLGGTAKFAETFPASFAKLKPYLDPEMLAYYENEKGIYPPPYSEASMLGKGSPPSSKFPPDTSISQAAIDKQLKENPGASIFDIAGSQMQGSSWQKKAELAKAYAAQNALRPKDFPHEIDFAVSPRASELGFNTPAVHGTPDRYGWEGPLDQLKLPDEQLGVHFGNPAQAAHFSLPGNVPEYLSAKDSYRASQPRTYPVMLQVQHPLETNDMGSWGVDNMKEALGEINRGNHVDWMGGGREISPQYKGMFPDEELDKLKNIQDVRDYISSKGFDSLKYTNTVEDPGHTSYILFNESPTQKGYVIGARSPFARFDPSKLHLPSLAATGAGILAYPLDRSGREEQ